MRFVLNKISCMLLCFSSVSIAEIPFYNRFDKEKTVQFLKQFIHPGDLVFDVGANKGDKADVYVACGARVICFEPQPSCVEQLKRRYNNNPDVTIEPIGLAEEKGALELMICDQASTLSTFNQEATQEGRFAERNFRWNKRVNVEVHTLDEMIAKHGIPVFCKIDVENFELNVLRGLSVPIRCLSFECNSEYMQQTYDCIDHLSKMGYKKFNFCIGETSVFKFSQWLDADEIKEKLYDLARDYDWSEIWGLWGDVYALYDIKNN